VIENWDVGVGEEELLLDVAFVTKEANGTKKDGDVHEVRGEFASPF